MYVTPYLAAIARFRKEGSPIAASLVTQGQVLDHLVKGKERAELKPIAYILIQKAKQLSRPVRQKASALHI